jgi:Zn-dependent protease with chaperone function
MRTLAAETILHGIVAAVATLMFLRLRPVHVAKIRLRFWLLALACPVVLTPVCSLLAPFRRGETFRDERAIFSGSHFANVQWQGIHPGAALLVALALMGTALFLRDLIPFAWDVMRGRANRNEVGATPKALVVAVERAAAALGVSAPRLLVEVTRQPILICRGLRRPTIVASTGLVEWLAPDELEAAVAHEMNHVARRDPALGWGLMLARGLFFFNPAIQLIARAAVQEIERRADAAAVHSLGNPRPLVRGLQKIIGVSRTNPNQLGASGWQDLHLHAIERRCRVLFDERAESPGTPARWGFVALAVGLGVILFFTVA